MNGATDPGAGRKLDAPAGTPTDGRPLRHLLGIRELTPEQLEGLVSLAGVFYREIESEGRTKGAVRRWEALRGQTVLNCFIEASTRTRVSFELAGKRLSADVVNFGGAGTSAEKGETLLDTARTLDAMEADVVVLRHAASGGPHSVAPHLRACVVNAGDGMHEHPTQALLDCATLQRAKGRLAGLEIAIVGDIVHSRVARSDVLAFTRLGAKVRLCAPATLLPHGGLPGPGVRVCSRRAEALEGADVVMTLRLQKERMQRALLPSAREYAREYGIDERALRGCKPDVLVMHPGPINRGVELSPGLADAQASLVLEQVRMGVAVRMAVLYVLAHPDPAEARAALVDPDHRERLARSRAGG